MNVHQSKLHPSIAFAVSAFGIRSQMSEIWSNKTGRQVSQDWRKGARNVTHGTWRIWEESVILAGQIESWLRREAQRHLKSRYGDAWWTQVPADIRKAARWRHKLSIREVGARRTGRLEDLKWLSFGDIIKLIKGFAPGEQWHILRSTELRPTWWKAADGAKWFRNSVIAHPTIMPGRYALTRLCTSAEGLADQVASSELQRCIQFFKFLGTIVSKDSHQDPLLNDSFYFGSMPRPHSRSSLSIATARLQAATQQRDPSMAWIATPHDAEVISFAWYQLEPIVKYFGTWDDRFSDAPYAKSGSRFASEA